MTRPKWNARQIALGLSVLLLLAAGVLGCGRLRRRAVNNPDSSPILSVEPVSNTNSIRLTVDDVLIILGQLGLTEQQILEIGEDLRNALLNYGGAKIYVGKKADVALRVEGFHVWIQSLSRGSFIYDAKSREFTLAPRAQAR